MSYRSTGIIHGSVYVTNPNKTLLGGAVWQSQGPPKDHGNMDEEQTENNHGIFYTFGCRGVDVPMMFLNTNQRVAPNKVVKEMLHSFALRNANRPLCGFCMLLCLWWFGNLSTKQDILQFLNGHRRSGNLDSGDEPILPTSVGATRRVTRSFSRADVTSGTSVFWRFHPLNVSAPSNKISSGAAATVNTWKFVMVAVHSWIFKSKTVTESHVNMASENSMKTVAVAAFDARGLEVIDRFCK